MAKVSNTLVEVGCKEQTKINANGIEKEPQPIIEAFVANFHQDGQIVDENEPNTFCMVPPILESGLQESQALKGAIEHESFPNSIPTTSMVRALTQKPSVTILVKDSEKKQPSDVDTSMPRKKVGAHFKSPIRKHDYVVSKKRKKGACVDPGAIALAKYAHQKGKTIST
jgi:hypothetical protein